MNNVLSKKFRPKLLLNEFLEECQMFIQEYSCPLCEGILNDSVIDKCGHSYCRECIETLLKETNLCPFTNTPITVSSSSSGQEQLSANIVVNSVIEKQKVYCKNKNSDCVWTGKLLERKNHLQYDCEKELVECEYSSECDIKIQREHLQEHLKDCPFRIVLCHHCQNQINFNKVEEHYKSCSFFPVKCRNNCGEMIPSSKMTIHLESQCLNSIVECPFLVVGCEFIETRRELKIHINDNLEEHLKLISQKMKNMEDIISNQTGKIKNLESDNEKIKTELESSKNMIHKSQEEIVSSINLLSRNIENIKLYFPIPQSNYLPNFFDSNYLNQSNSTQLNQIFKIDNENYSITKIQENYGWYGISSQNVDFSLRSNLNQSISHPLNGKFIINFKILKSQTSCVMFGISFSNQKSPLKNGFYNSTENENISYMFYAYNSSLYIGGRSMTQPGLTSSCSDGDVITLIIDTILNTISFRKNGNLIIEPFEVKMLGLEEARKNLKVCVDFCENSDSIMFLI
jgi:hypothetical protein